MKKKTSMLFIAGMIVLALFVPAVAAADYPNHPQFIAYYEPGKISIEESPDAGTTYYNADAASRVTRTTRSVEPDDWPQFMQNPANTGYSECDNVPWYPTVDHTSGIDVIGAINPAVVKNASGKIKILVMTGYPGFEETTGLTEVYLTCIDRETMSIDWQHPLPREPDHNGYYTNSWSSPATDGTYAYASSDNKTVCVDLTTGAEVWTFTMRYKNCDGSPTIGGNYLFCSDWGDGYGSGGNYYCLDKDDGDLNWIFNNTLTRREDMGYTQGTPAYDPTEGTEGKIYVTGYGYDTNTSHTGQLYKVDVATGTEDWGYGVGNQDSFCGSASIDGDYIYLTSYTFAPGNNGKLYKIKKDRSTAVSTAIERTDATPSIDHNRQRVYVSCGSVAVGADPAVRCYSTNLNLVDSRVNQGIGGWTCSVAIAESDDDDPGDANRLVFAGKEDPTGSMGGCYNTTYALNADSHLATKWSYPNGGGTAAIAWDEVYTVDHDGDLYIFT